MSASSLPAPEASSEISSIAEGSGATHEPSKLLNARARPRTKTRTCGRRVNAVISFASIPLFLCIWEVVSRSGFVNEVLFPPPTVVVQALRDWIISGDFFHDLLASLARVACGFTLGSVCGIVMGVLTGRVAFFASLFGPTLQVLRPIPPIAFVSVVILWFGIAESGKVFLIFWSVFFMVWLSANLGVQKVDQGLIRAAQMLGTPRLRLLTEIVLLGALPYIVVGLRTAVGISFYTLVAAELAGAFSGVFYRISLAQENMQTGQVFGGLVVLGATSFLADRSFAALAARLVWWR